ncbi:hypothetical protein F5B20DRAFT_566546 [Whalleya microplaca]|nr:hypothetical protein F5B20DRAFT_566546 [Whalleya microplaca]
MPHGKQKGIKICSFFFFFCMAWWMVLHQGQTVLLLFSIQLYYLTKYTPTTRYLYIYVKGLYSLSYFYWVMCY